MYHIDEIREEQKLAGNGNSNNKQQQQPNTSKWNETKNRGWKKNKKDEEPTKKEKKTKCETRIEYNIIYIIAVTVVGSQLYNIGSSTATTTSIHSLAHAHNEKEINRWEKRYLDTTQARKHTCAGAAQGYGWHVLHAVFVPT